MVRRVMATDLLHGIEKEAMFGAGTVSRVVFAPDGESFVTLGSLGVQEWCIDEGAILRRFALPCEMERKQHEPVEAVYSADGRWLAVWSTGRTLSIVDRTEGTTRAFNFTDETGSPVDLAFSPDGLRVLVSGPTSAWFDVEEGEVHRVDNVEGRPIGFAFDGALAVETERWLNFVELSSPSNRLRRLELPIRRHKVQLSSDGTRLIAFAASRTVVIDLETHKTIAEVAGEAYLAGNGLAFRADDTDSAMTKLWLLPLSSNRLPFFPEQGEVSLRLNLQTTFSISPTLDRAIEVDPSSGWIRVVHANGPSFVLVRTLGGEKGTVISVSANADLERAIVIGVDEGLEPETAWAEGWDLSEAAPLGAVAERLPASVHTLTFSSDDELAVPQTNGDIVICDPQGIPLGLEYEGLDEVTALAMSRDGEWLVAAGLAHEERVLALWRRGQEQSVARWPIPEQVIQSLVFLHDDLEIALSGSEGLAVIDRDAFFDEDERMIQRFDLDGAEWAGRLVSSPDGLRVAATTSHGVFVFEGPHEWERLGHWPSGHRPFVIAMPASWLVVFATEDDHGLRMVDIDRDLDHALGEAIQGHGEVVSVCFDIDASRMLVARARGELSIYRFTLDAGELD